MRGSGGVPFADRVEAGRRLAERLVAMRPADPVVYALPRGGVPVAAEVARALDAPLDLLLVRKIGAPGQPELALGAVADGGELVLNPEIIAATGASETFIEDARRAQLTEIERRRGRYMAGRAPLDLRGRTAVVVDDGLATGATARAALHALRQRGAARLILAVPVAPPDAAAALRADADEVVVVLEAEPFGGVGAFYADFHQLGDEEVVAILARHASGT